VREQNNPHPEVRGPSFPHFQLRPRAGYHGVYSVCVSAAVADAGAAGQVGAAGLPRVVSVPVDAGAVGEAWVYTSADQAATGIYREGQRDHCGAENCK